MSYPLFTHLPSLPSLACTLSPACTTSPAWPPSYTILHCHLCHFHTPHIGICTSPKSANLDLCENCDHEGCHECSVIVLVPKATCWSCGEGNGITSRPEARGKCRSCKYTLEDGTAVVGWFVWKTGKHGMLDGDNVEDVEGMVRELERENREMRKKGGRTRLFIEL